VQGAGTAFLSIILCDPNICLVVQYFKNINTTNQLSSKINTKNLLMDVYIVVAE